MLKAKLHANLAHAVSKKIDTNPVLENKVI